MENGEEQSKDNQAEPTQDDATQWHAQDDTQRKWVAQPDAPKIFSFSFKGRYGG